MSDVYDTPAISPPYPCKQISNGEIRVARRLADQTSQPILQVNSGHWHPDSPSNRKMLSVIAYSGNEIYGPNTHWIEEREGRTHES